MLLTKMQDWFIHYIRMIGGGTSRLSIHAANGNLESRYIDPKNDMYPPPLSSRGVTRQYKHDIVLHVLYFQTNRIKEIIKEHQDDDINAIFIENRELIARQRYDKYSYMHKEFPTFDEYKQFYFDKYKTIDDFDSHPPANLLNILDELNLRYLHYGDALTLICSSNMHTNIPYQGNEFLWNETFMALVESLTKDNLIKGCQYSPTFRCNAVQRCIYEERYLWLLILMHYGVKPDRDTLKDLQGFWKSDRLDTIINSDLEENVLCSLLEDYTCPLSCDPVEHPVILEDGNIYEKDLILKWLETHDTSPLTNVKLKYYWMGFDILNNKIVYAERYDLVSYSRLFK